ncbi:MAG: AAA family ATPase [Candidatus Thiodiazotropha taylori]|nr:AAA family ATPase [Candidatus Thiodiazotropha taylori]MCW4308797.1 AAA family ATPase [Candidatus Thiodiazotropha endolucinida]
MDDNKSDRSSKKCKVIEENPSRKNAHGVSVGKKYGSIDQCISQFHRNIATGPIFVCTCCHQTWFQKSVSALKRTFLSATCISNYCTKLISVNNEEWICHTCLSLLKDGKVPKLSVANGMKWPDKPPELDLHQLEERLIALRIPFMQIRELPRGGQYSIKGNVINVPIDIQPTVNSLPRPMDENFTVAVQLKKKLSYKKVDFKENVRPLRVLTALHWLVNKSELYKKSDIVIDDNWYQEVTESAEDTVKEFLEGCNENIVANEGSKVSGLRQDLVSSLNRERNVEENDSDGFSEIDSGEIVGNVDTLVEDANVESKYDQVFTFAPGEGQQPLSLYQDKDAEYLCFPTIFCGQRRLINDERQTPVYYSDIVKWELRSVDRRAAQSVPNIFFKHKKLQMKQISDKVNLALRRCKNKGKTITAGEARDPACMDKLVKLDEGYYIFRQLRNSPAYLEARKKDIFAMIRQLSLPTWFMSLSAADTRWSDLLKMLAKLNDAVDYSDEDIEALTWQERTKLVQKDPVTCSRYFDHRVQEFLNTVLKSDYQPVGKITDFFYRVEFQQRGSPHIHMLVWIENSPKFEKNSDEEIVKFVDQYLTCSIEHDDISDLVDLQMHKHSKSCRKKGNAICRFGFPLPPLPRTMLLHPLQEEVDEYKRKYTELQKTMNEYKDNSEITFDEFLENIVKMNFDDYIKCIKSSLNTAKVFLKRKPKEMRVNLFNKQILYAWKANLDIQIILEPYGCATYVVGYISKSQRGMSAQLDAAAKEARKGNSDLKKQVRHIGNVFSNCVEVSAQEAVYLTLQIPLTKATRDVVFINTSSADERVFLLKPKSILDELPPESTDIESDNVIQRYSKRPRQLQQFCLADYVSKVDIIYPKGNILPEKNKDKNEDDASASDSSDDYEDDEVDKSERCASDVLCMTKNGTRFKLRATPKIIRYVRYNKQKDPENYYRERLMLFMPWRNEAKDLIGSFDTYKAHYYTLKTTIEPKQNEYEHHVEELEIARQIAEADEDAYDRIAPNTEQENREAEEEGDKEAEPFIYFNPDRVVEHRQYDIGIEIQATCSVPSVQTNSVLLPEDQYLCLLRSLNLRQREFFNHVIFWLKCKEEPLYAFLSGGAGVGKSVLIKALYQSLYRFLNLREGENPDDIRILLCAYTGKAAYNINGVTIASAFLKKFKQANELLSADELNTFRVKYRHLKLIIIDEISMVGTSTLSFLDTRLQQLTGTKTTFGGISIIAVGDLYQLMPVCDKWIFSDQSKGASSLAPNLWRDYFRMYELVDIMRQKDDIHFAQLLNRLRQNELTDDDKSELKRHTIDPEVDAYPKQAPHLFTENKFVTRHNDSVLNRLSEEKVLIPCHDTIVVANISAQKSKALIESLPEDSNKTANLEKLLKMAVGMVYDITVNINVEDGLTNGSTCVAKYIEHKMEATDRPSIIWVLFDDPGIGISTREKSLNRGLYSSNIDHAWTPIFDIERSFIYNFKTYQRIQFPLKPSAGKTVHKAQGSTVDEIVVDLSQSRVRKQPHIHYVALSRVRKLENLFILNLNEEALAVDEKVKVEMQRLQTEGLLELCYTPLYKVDPCKIKILFNNARSLHKHFHEIENEPNVLSADVIGFAETRLCSRDENIQFNLKRFRLLRLDETQQYTVNRPYHGLALYVREGIEIQKIEKFHSSACEFILARLKNDFKCSFQVVIFYKYPKSSQTVLKNDMLCHLMPLIDLNVKLVILGDFNLDVNKTTMTFVDFMQTQFGCQQLISKPTTDAGSLLDLLFANCQCSCDVVEAYWTDHKLVYCAFQT